jgi:SAM-dependent methyltransferase
MNQSHIEFLSSPEWARMLETDLLPWVEDAGDLGEDVLEIGPGPGLTTDLLRKSASHLTAMELDQGLAEALKRRMEGTNVEVFCGDATSSTLQSDRFTAVTCFSVLHHLPSPEDQDRLFAEIHRMLRPGGIFVGADSRDLEAIRLAHEDDTFTPIDPDALADRLARVALTLARIDVGDYQYRFMARKPALWDRSSS